MTMSLSEAEVTSPPTTLWLSDLGDVRCADHISAEVAAKWRRNLSAVVLFDHDSLKWFRLTAEDHVWFARGGAQLACAGCSG